MNRIVFMIVVIISTVITHSCKKDKDEGIINLPGNFNNKSVLVTSVDSLFFNGPEVKEIIITTVPFTETSYIVYQDINAPWIVVDNFDYSITSSADTLRVSTDFSNTPNGFHESYIEIASDHGSKMIYVRAVVGYSVPDSITIAPFENTKTISIGNPETSPLNYSIAVSNNYLSASTPTGTLPAGQVSDISFTVNRAGMVTGNYNSQIYLTVNNKIDTIQVTIESFVQ